MDWREAVSFCEWLTRVRAKEFPEESLLACLPTEVEWEYACRGRTATEYHTGDGEAALAEAGWFGEAWGTGSTHPVGKLKSNRFKLYDLHGHVWEWCHDALEAGRLPKSCRWRRGSG